MRIATIGTILSLAAFGIVSARDAESGDVRCSGAPAQRTCSTQPVRKTRSPEVMGKSPETKMNPHIADKPHGSDGPHLPNFPNIPNIPNLPNIPGLGSLGNLGNLGGLGGLGGLGNLGNLPNIPNIPNLGNGQHRPDKPKTPNPATCTDQPIDCNFLRATASSLQNEEDDCLRLAAGLDTNGKLSVEPLAQDNNNVVYGITIDGLTSSAWCTDIGWALRRILTTCRRGKTCYGGNAPAARNSVFMVAAGSKFNPTVPKPPGGPPPPKIGPPPPKGGP